MTNKYDYSALSDNDLDNLYQKAEEEYRKGTPIMTDHEFSLGLIPAIKARFGEKHRAFTEVGAEPENMFNTGTKVEHEEMLSIENFFTTEEVNSFFQRIKKSQENHLEEVLFSIQSKLDGMSGLYLNDRVSTRGDKKFGEDVTKLFNWGVIAVGGKNTGPGEFVINKKYFYENLFGEDKYTDPRNFVVGISRSLQLNKLQLKALNDGAVVFMPYSMLPTKIIKMDEFFLQREVLEEEFITECDYPADGLVIECIDRHIQGVLGTNSKYKRWQAAIKRNNEKATVVVTSIDAKTGRTGIVAPRAFFESTFLSGANISVATGHNLENFYKKGLGVGAIIEIVRSGKVIPKIEAVITPSEKPFILYHCPTCNSELDFSGKVARCLNENCEARVNKKIIHFFDTIKNSKGIGKETILKLIDKGYDSIRKILDLTAEDLINMNFGEKSSHNFEMAILNILSGPIPTANFIDSLGVSFLGTRSSEALTKKYKLNEIINIKEEDIIKLPGFDVIKAVKISLEIEELQEVINDILETGINVVDEDVIESSNVLINENIAFTGEMPVLRKKLEEHVKFLGGKVSSSVTKNTTILVIGDKVGERKIESAIKNGTKIMTYNEYVSFLENLKA